MWVLKMVNIEFKYLTEYVENVDTFVSDKTISTAEYMQICLLMKIFETLQKMDKKLWFRPGIVSAVQKNSGAINIKAIAIVVVNAGLNIIKDESKR